jgi:outer membrane receptor protein involved in Fe transport
MKVFKKSAIGMAVSSLVLATGTTLLVAPAMAQQAPAQPAGDAKEADTLKLDQVVITATTGTKSKMRSSVSVTDVDGERIKELGAKTESEILLMVPGIRTNPDAGPGGNSNISVRGLPISSGGSKYVQLQEDGLPTVQFGDMNFSNNDYWIRFDNNVDRIETLRGGSSSIFASHAPGAVLNYISKTGKDEGGSIGVTRGINYKESRFDGDYGGRLAPDLYFHIGGYYREGETARHYGENALQGHQIKANITKEFNGGKGYVRVNFKSLDEHAPTTPQTFVRASRSGDTIGGFSKLPGYDGTRDTQYSIYNSSVPGIDPVTRQLTTTSLRDGITVNSQAWGAEFHNELKNGWTVDDKFRMSKNAGAFQTQFWDVKALDTMLTGLGGGSASYYNGPQAGATVTASNLGTGLVSQGAAINTTTPDMGNLFNDLSVNKQFLVGNGMALDAKGGWFHSRQNVVQRWQISERVVQAAPNGAVIDVFDANGAALTTAGLTGYNNQWGGCCARDINAVFTTDAPYLNLNLATGDLDLEGGFRRETFKANGRYAAAKQVAGGFDVNGDGTITGAEKNVYFADTNNPGLVNYSISYTNYSFGANYRLNKDLSVFARHSKGNRAIADRLLYSANIDAATGLLTNPTAALAPVKQSELGTKFRGRMSGVNYGLMATYFHSTTTEFDYDQTRPDVPPNDPNYRGPKLNIQSFKADGVELESTASSGAWGLNLNVVYSKESITGDLGAPQRVGKTSSGVPRWRYNISPRYTSGPLTFGATVRGQSWVYQDGNNTIKINGHYIVNAFASVELGDGLSASVNVGNLFNKVYPTADGGFIAGTNNTVFGAGMENGRNISASLKYNF